MRGLQRQLTLSHLLVTVVSVLILVVGILGGYAIYLRSDWSARWAGDVAANYADDFAAWSSTEGAGAPIDEFVSLDFSSVSEPKACRPSWRTGCSSSPQMARSWAAISPIVIRWAAMCWKTRPPA
jgi:hypothetical protein